MQLSVQNTTAIIGKYKNISGITGEITVHVPKTARVELSVKNVTSITGKEKNITEVTGEITVHCDEQACRSGTGNFIEKKSSQESIFTCFLPTFHTISKK